MQLSAAKVKETSCIGAFRARVLIKELTIGLFLGLGINIGLGLKLGLFVRISGDYWL